jgi:predicted transcriptional regulator
MMNKHVMAIQVRAARAALKWKQSELAQRAGISEPAVNRLERGENEPRYSTFASVINVFREAGVILDNTPDGDIKIIIDANVILDIINNFQKRPKDGHNDQDR